MYGPGVAPPAVSRALGSGKVDVVIAPFFNMRINSAQWPPAPEVQAAAQAAFAPLLATRGLQIERTRWFATIRLRARTAATVPSAWSTRPTTSTGCLTMNSRPPAMRSPSGYAATNGARRPTR